jgi:MarR family transcriptional regulator for hemolysin
MAEIDSMRQEVTAELQRASRRWHALVEQRFLPFKLSASRAAPLIWISRLGGGAKQSTVADRIGVRASTLALLLNQLEADKLIERHDDPEDRRAKTLWLSSEAALLVAELERRLDELCAVMMADISADEIATSLKVLHAFQLRRRRNNRG